MTAFGQQNQVITLTPTGRIDSAFLNGADGSDLVPVWLGTPALQLLVGVALSTDLANVLTDPGSPTSTLAFYPVSGTDPLTAGFSIAGTVLSNACLRVASGVFRLVAIRGAISVLSAPIAYAITTPTSVVDNVGPSIPTGLTAVPGTAVGTAIITFDAPSDLAPPNAPAAGVVHVDVFVAGTLAAPSPILVPSNALITPTDVIIGGIASPDLPMSSQNGKVFTLTAAGTGIAGTTAEQCLFTDCGVFTGAQHIVAKLNPYVSASATALMGLMLHETAVAGGKFFAVGLRPSNGTVALVVESRATASAASTQVAILTVDNNGQPLTGPVYVHITRAADGKTLTVSYALTEVGGLAVTTQTLAMNAAVHFGMFITSQSAGVDVTGMISELSINNTPTVSATVPLSAPANVALRATDAGGNVSAISAPIFATPKIVLVGGNLKNHPGWYMGSNNINGGHDNNVNEYNVLAASGPQVIGWFGIYQWSNFETADGVYNFSILANHFNALQAKKPGARFGIMIWCEAFSGTTVSFGIPSYILNNALYGPGADGIHTGYWPLSFSAGGGTAAIWRAAVNERYTRLFEHLAAASFLTTAGPYAGQTFTFDTHPLIEGIHDQESSLSIATGSDYNETTFANLSLQRYARSASAFVHTTFAPQINFLNGSPPAVGTLVTGAFNSRCGISWPDTNGVALVKGVSPGVTWGQHFYRGDAYNGTAFVAGGTDRRGGMPCMGWIQSPDYKPYTAADMLAGMLALRVTHGIWTYNAGGNGDWVSNVLPLLQTNSVNNTACPTNYNGQCFSG